MENRTYQTEQCDPRCGHECRKECGDDLGGNFLLGTEGVYDGWLGMEGRFVGVGCRRGRCGDIEVKEVERRWVMHERAEDEGDGERAVGRRWEGWRRTRHVLGKRQDVSVETLGCWETYELKLGLAALGDANGLNAFFTGDGVVEAEEGLVGLYAVALVGFGDLEGEFEDVGGAKG